MCCIAVIFGLKAKRRDFLRGFTRVGRPAAALSSESKRVPLSFWSCPSLPATQVLDETVVVNHSDDSFAPVGLLRVITCHTEPKAPLAAPASSVAAAGTSALDGSGTEEGEVAGRGGDTIDRQVAVGVVAPAGTGAAAGAAARVAEAAGGDVDTSSVVGAVDGGASSAVGSKEGLGTVAAASPSPSLGCLPHVHEGSGGLVYLSGVRSSRRAGEAGAGAGAEVVAGQAADCLGAALAALEDVGVSFRDVCFVHLYLRDMGHFSDVNDEYCK